MKKLALNVANLLVDSFEITLSPDRTPGTVRTHAAEGDDIIIKGGRAQTPDDYTFNVILYNCISDPAEPTELAGGCDLPGIPG